MRPSIQFPLVLLVALAFSAPAAAQWFAYGSFEPDTPYDDESWMWAGPPPVGAQRVYFNVIPTTQDETVNGKPVVNPNVAILRTQIEPFADERHVGLFGVWVDCNGDDYVGMAETAVREYSAELLASEDVCPPVTGPANAWTAGAHNYNGWVSEFVPIVRGAAAGVADKRTYRDDDSAIWGDFHRPDERPWHRSCALIPFPRGTLETTGGVINYVDCRFDLLGPANDAFALVGDPLGLRFADEDDARTGTLGQVALGGPESDSHSPASVWDCNDQTRVGDVANTTPVGPLLPNIVANSRVAGVDPAVGNTQSPSVAGFVNHTHEGVMVGGVDDCDSSNDFGHDVYSAAFGLPEADFNGVHPNNKTEADWNFLVSPVSRGNVALSLAGQSLGGTGGAHADLGVGTGGTRWLGDSFWFTKPGPRSVRLDLQNGGVAIAPAYWLSFYAKVGSATTQRGLEMPGGESKYGSWHCEDDFDTPGIRNGWNCDRSLWYLNPDGTPYENRETLAQPGDLYQFRDVDCYDGRIGGTGIAVQPAFYGPEPCP